MPIPAQSYTEEYKFPEETWGVILKPLRNQKSASYLELGVFEGRSLVWVAKNILPPASRLEVVDCFLAEGLRERFNKNVEVLYSQNELKVHHGWVADILPKLNKNEYDLIYVDADHSYLNVWNDLVQSWPLLKTGGYMVIDDYIWLKFLLPSAQRPEKAIDDFLRASGRSHRLILKDAQVFLQKTAELPDSLKTIGEDSPQIPKGSFLPPKKMGSLFLRGHYFFFYLKRLVYLKILKIS